MHHSSHLFIAAIAILSRVATCNPEPNGPFFTEQAQDTAAAENTLEAKQQLPGNRVGVVRSGIRPGGGWGGGGWGGQCQQTGDCRDCPNFGVVNQNFFFQQFGVAIGAEIMTRFNQCFEQCYLECNSRADCTGFQWNRQHDGVESVCRLKTGQINFQADPGQCDDPATGRTRCFSFIKNGNGNGGGGGWPGPGGGGGWPGGGGGDCRRFPGQNAGGNLLGFIPRPGTTAVGGTLPGYPMYGQCFDSCSSSCQGNPDCGGFLWKRLDRDGLGENNSKCDLKFFGAQYPADPGACQSQTDGQNNCYTFEKNPNGGNGGGNGGDCKRFPQENQDVPPGIFQRKFGQRSEGGTLPGYPIYGSCLSVCAQNCAGNPECAGFQFNRAQNDGQGENNSKCWLKPFGTTYVSDPGQCNGQDGRVVCYTFEKNQNGGNGGGNGGGDCKRFPQENQEVPPGIFQRKLGQRLEGGTLPGYPIYGSCLSVCAQKCSENPECRHFQFNRAQNDGLGENNSKCWLKPAGNTYVSDPGQCNGQDGRAVCYTYSK